MNVKNQIQTLNNLNPRKKVPYLDIKTSKLHIASFLECY